VTCHLFALSPAWAWRRCVVKRGQWVVCGKWCVVNGDVNININQYTHIHTLHNTLQCTSSHPTTLYTTHLNLLLRSLKLVATPPLFAISSSMFLAMLYAPGPGVSVCVCNKACEYACAWMSVRLIKRIQHTHMLVSIHNAHKHTLTIYTRGTSYPCPPPWR
jgi:hypothetical protein